MSKHTCPECGVVHSTEQKHSHTPKQANKHGTVLPDVQAINGTNVPFATPGYYTGRNGTFAAAGIVVEQTADGTVILRPLTTKGAPANCMIQIPADALQKFVTVVHSGCLNLPGAGDGYPETVTKGVKYATTKQPLVEKALKLAQQVIKQQAVSKAQTIDELAAALATPSPAKVSKPKKAPKHPPVKTVTGHFSSTVPNISEVPTTDTAPGKCTCSKTGKWVGCPVHDPAKGGTKPLVNAGGWVVDPLV